MTEPRITYSDRLRKARIERGLRQVELAQLLGISSSTVSTIENGHQAPSFPLVLRWALACEVSLDWVAGLDGLDWATWQQRQQTELELLQVSSS